MEYLGQPSLELHLVDEQSVEFCKRGALCPPSEGAQLVFGIRASGTAPVEGGVKIWFVIHTFRFCLR